MSLVHVEASNPLRGNSVFDITSRQKWLNKELGLHFDPFRYLDAGADPHLPAYLVDHGAFGALWGNWPSFLFAPVGGGKTAFRVRLARACRVEQDGKRVFPVVFHVPRPEDLELLREELYFEALLNEAAAALLLELAYRPGRFLDLDTSLREDVRVALDQNLPGHLDYYIAQLEESGSMEPLSRAFDPTAVGLPGEPLPERIGSLCAAMRETAVRPMPSPGPLTRLEQMIALLKDSLGYEAIYILADGVDAYVQEPSVAARLLKPLLVRTRAWSEQALFVKYFLPNELVPRIKEEYQSLLTPPSKVAIIRWGVDSLVEVVRERLRVASEGMFDSLTAISLPDASDQVEKCIAKTARPAIPREVIRLVRRVFIEHIKRVGSYGRLEQRDFDAALDWYPGS